MNDTELSPRRRLAAAGTRVDAFCQHVNELFIPLHVEVQDRVSFNGQLQVVPLGALSLSEIALCGTTSFRTTPQTIARTAHDYLKVDLVLSGRCRVAQDGREAVLNSGDFVMYDGTRPFRLVGENSLHLYGLVIPAPLLGLSRTHILELTARRFGGQRGTAALASQFLRQLGAQLAVVGQTNNFHVADATLSLLTGVFSDHPKPMGNSRELLLRIRVFIENQLGDPRLDVAQIAAAHHISVRQLQKMFKDDGQTVTGWIRSRRLEHCRRDLSNIALADMTVGQICLRWGFIDAAHFSKIFKAVLGLPPRDFRAQAQEIAADETRSRICEARFAIDSSGAAG